MSAFGGRADMIFCGADTISQQYRQLAEECRKSAQTFSDPNARTRMLETSRLNMSGRAKKLKRELRRVKQKRPPQPPQSLPTGLVNISGSNAPLVVFNYHSQTAPLGNSGTAAIWSQRRRAQCFFERRATGVTPLVALIGAVSFPQNERLLLFRGIPAVLRNVRA